jgi:hypothetical protein
MSIANCLIAEGRQLSGCQKNNVGGIKKVYIANHTEVYETIIEDGTMFTGSTVEEVVEITMGMGSTFYTFDTVKETSSFSQTINASIQNGTLSYVPTVSLIFNKLEASTRNIIQMLATSLVDVIILDSNDKLWYMGRVNGMDLTAAEMGSGVAQADRNGSTLTFTGAEPESLRQIYTIEAGNDAIIQVVNGQIEVSGTPISSY